MYYLEDPRTTIRVQKAAIMRDSTRSTGAAMTDTSEVPRIKIDVPYVFDPVTTETALAIKAADMHKQ